VNEAEDNRSFPIIPLVVAGVLGIVLLLGILWLGRPESERGAPPVPAKLPPLADEAVRYAEENIELGPVSLSRWQNFLGQVVTYVDGTVKNTGTWRVVALELTLEFHDIFGQVVLRETVRPVGEAPGRPRTRLSVPIEPGESRAYRVPLEHIPAEWNYGAPHIRVTGLLLQ